MASVRLSRCLTRYEAMTDFPQPGSADSQRTPETPPSNQSLYFECSVTQVQVPSTGARTRPRCSSYLEVFRRCKISAWLLHKSASPWWQQLLWMMLREPIMVLEPTMLPETAMLSEPVMLSDPVML